MKSQTTRRRLATALASAVGTAIGRRNGDRAYVVPADQWGDTGWVATVPVAGRAIGTVAVWFDREGSLAAMAGDEGLPEVVLNSLVEEAVYAVQAHFTTLAFGAVTVAESGPAAGIVPLTAVHVMLSSGVRCPIAVGVELTIQTDVEDDRLESVLDFDLPLVVRFGSSTMPLKVVASLGPGAMIDLGRTPEQPVELLIGDRVVALGEVVVVGGNYGVRITELTAAHRTVRPAFGGTA